MVLVYINKEFFKFKFSNSECTVVHAIGQKSKKNHLRIFCQNVYKLPLKCRIFLLVNRFSLKIKRYFLKIDRYDIENNGCSQQNTSTNMIQ